MVLFLQMLYSRGFGVSKHLVVCRIPFVCLFVFVSVYYTSVGRAITAIKQREAFK